MGSAPELDEELLDEELEEELADELELELELELEDDELVDSSWPDWPPQATIPKSAAPKATDFLFKPNEIMKNPTL